MSHSIIPPEIRVIPVEELREFLTVAHLGAIEKINPFNLRQNTKK